MTAQKILEDLIDNLLLYTNKFQTCYPEQLEEISLLLEKSRHKIEYLKWTEERRDQDDD